MRCTPFCEMGSFFFAYGVRRTGTPFCEMDAVFRQGLGGRRTAYGYARRSVRRFGFVFLRLRRTAYGYAVAGRASVYRYAVSCTDALYAVLRNGFVFLRLRRTAYVSVRCAVHRCAARCTDASLRRGTPDALPCTGTP
jgi:hypothetical protein